MANILLIGCGAREHAIADAVKRSPQKPVLYAVMAWRNPALIAMCEDFIVAKYNDFQALELFVKKIKPEFCIIGPEQPLAEGVVDFLADHGIPCVGPTKSLARLETSKSFTRMLMDKYKIPGLPKFHVFDSMDGIAEFIDMLAEEGKQFVIKPDGLTGGKGVKVQGDHLKGKDDALDYCKEILAQGQVVIEEKLDGEEFSIQCFCDGKAVVPTPAAQDHKRAFDGDKGPNTGGMGSYSMENHLLPFLTQDAADKGIEITRRMAAALYEETGEFYKGIMYGGYILTREGVKLIEYNARFADPESMNVLTILVTDFVEICRAIINEELGDLEIVFASKATVCKYAVPQGYPDKPARGEEISLGEKIAGVKIYLASVEQSKGDPKKMVMLGSRAIAFVGIADTIQNAEYLAEKAVSAVQGPAFHRKDIGTTDLIDKRVDHIRKMSPR